jgi:soluble lytic murein transglycosylase-like protein
MALIVTLGLGVSAAADGRIDSTATAALPLPIRGLNFSGDLPHPLGPPDIDRYKQIFRLQDDGQWQEADKLIGRLTDLRLLGHVLAHRYLHPTKYTSSYPELATWLARYSDHPQGGRIHRLAMSRKPADAEAPAEPEAQVRRIGNPDEPAEPDDSDWQSGLTAWRAGEPTTAAGYFERVATDADGTPWTRAAGAFWAARCHLKQKRPQLVSRWLKAAAQHPRTFYGQVARRALGMDAGVEWTVRSPTKVALDTILGSRGGQRALALLQIGRRALAEDELYLLLRKRAADPEAAAALLAVAQMAGLPSLSLRLAVLFEERFDARIDAALYPLPSWRPRGGFIVDPALLFALMRQESAFDPRAESPMGAAGLMQLMPETAQKVADAGILVSDEKRFLFDPEYNLTLGQRYVNALLKHRIVEDDLVSLAVAYNAGAANLIKWRAEAAHGDDPLLFIESIPSRETRQFIERVLANYWIYRQRLGDDVASLDALASGGWPKYAPGSNLSRPATPYGPYN